MISESKRAYMEEYRRLHRERINAQQRDHYRLSGGREKRKARYSLPEVQAKARAYQKDRYRQPDVRAKALSYQAGYLSRPGVRERKRDLHLRRLYGLAPGDFEAMLAAQGGGCAVCGSPDWGGRGPVVDHDHSLGDVRGILCQRCNVAAGMLGDDPTLAKKLQSYLEKNRR